VDVGLHLTLTDQKPLGPMPRSAPSGRLPPFGAMLRGSYTGRLDREELRTELARQHDAFVEGRGREPDFLDGHHHVHQLPIIRELVADLFRERLSGRNAYVRTCAEPVGAILRRRVAVGRHLSFAWPGRGLRRVLARDRIPSNRGYSGAYDFSARVPYAVLFDRFLFEARDGMLINCHPGFVDAALVESDSLTAGREREYRFLSGTGLPETLARRRVVLGRLRPETGSEAPEPPARP
jgi:chitin disaccharide deacetylase